MRKPTARKNARRGYPLQAISMSKGTEQSGRFPHNPRLTALGLLALTYVLIVVLPALPVDNYSPVTAEIILIIFVLVGGCAWAIFFVRAIRLIEIELGRLLGRLLDKINNWSINRRAAKRRDRVPNPAITLLLGWAALLMGITASAIFVISATDWVTGREEALVQSIVVGAIAFVLGVIWAKRKGREKES